MAETFVNLVTGATLPDRGEVTIFGRPTTAIDDSADWLSVVDRFGIVSERAVLLDALSVIQNLSIPFTLDIDPPPDDVRERADPAGAGGRASAKPIGRVPCRSLTRRAGSASVWRERWRSIRKCCCSSTRAPGSHADAAAALGADIRQIASRRGCALVAVDGGSAVCRGRCRSGADARPGDRAPVRIGAGTWSLFRRGGCK